MTLAAPALAYSLPSIGAGTRLPKKSVLVRAGQDRTGQPFQFLEATFTVKVSGKDNGGACVIFDTVRPEKVGPPLHVHKQLDEWFYVLEGEFKFQAGEDTMRLRAGDSLFVPREMAHAFVKTSEGVARLIVMHQPAGTMEEYFRAVSKLPDQSPEARKKMAAEHDTLLIGPPLKPD
ncbi:cupin domain-containing protein [Hymenobacter rigui]|uniref:cupin domain-containing protein n=1 Tax=Hymenobacter rigui TaxID=334424 RepID=UPI001476FA31|nr:cupin domain-containing protein [Hymenobacter rigui]